MAVNGATVRVSYIEIGSQTLTSGENLPERLQVRQGSASDELSGSRVITGVAPNTPSISIGCMRALRAVPALQQVRLASHAAVSCEQVLLLADVLRQVSADELRLVSRIVVELLYSTVEMIFDEPLDVKAVARTVAGMVTSHMVRLQAPDDAAARRPAGKSARRL